MADPILSRLVLKRFRSFPEEQVEFDNPTFLVGQNGSGKSNFADAFAFLAEAMASPLQAVFEHRGGLATVANRRSARFHSSTLGLAVELENLDDNTPRARYAFRLRGLEDYGLQVTRERCIVRRSDGSGDRFERVRPLRESAMVWRSTVESLRPVVEPHALALPLVGGDSRFQPVARFLSEMRVCRIEPVVLREMQEPDSGIRLRLDGSNAASVLREIERNSPDAWQQILQLLESVVPGTIGVGHKRHGNKLTLEFTQDWGNRKQVKFEAFNMSDGTLRVLGMLAAVFQRPAPSLLVVEEPEASVHPGVLGSVLDLLRHAGRFMQVVVTTHSPDILDAKWIEDRHLRIASWNQGATRIDNVSAETRAALAEHLMGAGELLRSNAFRPVELTEHDPRRYELFPMDRSA